MPTEDTPTDPEESGNALLLSPAFDADREAVCRELMAVEDAAAAQVLFVALTGTPDGRLERWRGAHAASGPAEVGIVTAGDGTGSASAASGTDTTRVAGGRVTTVGSPGDLTGIGIAVSEYLSEWADGGPIVVCFDSITTLLQYADVRHVFQFLHVLTRRFGQVEARAHFHMDPTAHDDQAVRTIASLFEAVRDTRETEQAATETD